MTTLDGLLRRIMGRKQRLEPGEIRRLSPRWNPAVEAQGQPDGSIVLRAPLRQTAKGIAGAIARKAGSGARKTFELEPVGAFVWKLCDGSRTFERIAQELRSELKMNRLEAETALAAYLQTLGRRGLISLEPPSDKKGK